MYLLTNPNLTNQNKGNTWNQSELKLNLCDDIRNPYDAPLSYDLYLISLPFLSFRGSYEYDLILSCDLYTKRHTQW